MNSTLSRYVSLCNFDRVKKTNKGWNFRCYVCGDSEQHKRKRRGNVIDRDDRGILYYCHNCGTSISFSAFLKKYKSHLYKDYKMELYKQKMMSNGEWIEYSKNIPIEEDDVPVEIPWIDSILDQLDSVDENDTALKYLQGRKIPESFINELYFCENYMKFLSDNKLKIIENIDKIKSDPRVVIPVYNIAKQITHLQGRSLDPDSYLRYVTCDLINDTKKIWGLDRVDVNKPIYIFEGVFDAIFIDNAIAGLGSFIDFDYLKKIAKNKLIYCPDADFRKNKFLEKNLINLVNKKIDLYFTPKDIKEKDINKMIENGWTKEKIQEMINTNTFSGAMALARIKFMKMRMY